MYHSGGEKVWSSLIFEVETLALTLWAYRLSCSETPLQWKHKILTTAPPENSPIRVSTYKIRGDTDRSIQSVTKFMNLVSFGYTLMGLNLYAQSYSSLKIQIHITIVYHNIPALEITRIQK